MATKDPVKRRAHAKRWRESEKGKAYYAKYRQQWEMMNKDRRSRINRRALLKHHGLTEADYDVMVSDRGGKCDLCLEKVDKLFVDHCHSTLVIRGLLCRHCNLALGHFKDRPEVLARAVSYLAKPQSSPHRSARR
jgi:hypothetical protein